MSGTLGCRLFFFFLILSPVLAQDRSQCAPNGSEERVRCARRGLLSLCLGQLIEKPDLGSTGRTLTVLFASLFRVPLLRTFFKKKNRGVNPQNDEETWAYCSHTALGEVALKYMDLTNCKDAERTIGNLHGVSEPASDLTFVRERTTAGAPAHLCHGRPADELVSDVYGGI